VEKISVTTRKLLDYLSENQITREMILEQEPLPVILISGDQDERGAAMLLFFMSYLEWIQYTAYHRSNKKFKKRNKTCLQ
jgi:hypothetical protein